jgi:hypothetical protein
LTLGGRVGLRRIDLLQRRLDDVKAVIDLGG